MVKETKFFQNNDVCPTCSQDISQKLRDEKIEAATATAKNINSTLQNVDTDTAQVESDMEIALQVQEKLRTAQQSLVSNNKALSRTNAALNNKRTDLSKIEQGGTDLGEAVDELNVLTTEKSSLMERKLEIAEQRNYNEVIGEMLKDTGIKTKIIKQYLPVINKLVNQYLQILDFFVHFDLDESFQETIRSRHRDEFTYDSFSEGEKQRIDLSLLFTWRQIAKMKNSISTNLLILDETFDSSLDVDGVENLQKILSHLNDTNVFVISHKGDILDGKFRSKIEFVKDKNFSKMVA